MAGFARTDSAKWNTLNLDGIDAKVAFSPHSSSNALLAAIAKDTEKTTSSLFFSLAFLYQTPGAMKDAIVKAPIRIRSSSTESPTRRSVV